MEKILCFLFFLYLVVFPFGQLVRLPLEFSNFPEINLYATDFLAGLICVFWFAGRQRSQNRAAPLEKPMLLFLASAAFSLLINLPALSARDALVSSLYLVRITVYGVLYLSLYVLFSKKVVDIEKVLLGLVTVGGAISIFSWYQYFFYPDLRPFAVWGWDEHYKRIFGTFLDPGFTAIILVFNILLIFGLLLERKKQVLSTRALLVFTVLTSFLALFFTYSRSGFLALAAGLVVLGIIRRGAWIFVLLAMLFLLLGISLIPKNLSEGTDLARTTSTFARVTSWENALKTFLSSPLFGVGFNSYRYAQEGRGFITREKTLHSGAGTDSSLLLVLATTGIVGFVLFTNLLLGFLDLGIDNYKTLGGAVFLASLASLFTNSLFINSIFFPQVLGWMAILAAILREKRVR